MLEHKCVFTGIDKTLGSTPVTKGTVDLNPSVRPVLITKDPVLRAAQGGLNSITTIIKSWSAMKIKTPVLLSEKKIAMWPR